MADEEFTTTSFRDPPPSTTRTGEPSTVITLSTVSGGPTGGNKGHRTEASRDGSTAGASSTSGSHLYQQGGDGSVRRHHHEKSLDLPPQLDYYKDVAPIVQTMLRKRPTLVELHELDTDELVDEDDSVSAVAGAEATGDPKKVAPKFGWIVGVFVRCLLNIFGVMLFMRISWVVGQAGIALATIIILLACTVTFLTALSMSAICTNGEVKGGGAYYMISRSLGPEFGGAIGIIFALANAVAVAMYVIGFSETIRDIIKDKGMQMVDDMNDVRIIGFITIFALLGIALAGLDWEARAQVFLLVILTIAIANVMIGTLIPTNETKLAMGYHSYSGELFVKNFTPAFRGGYGFFTVFAIFFPAATGILAGANISGDLKDPQMAIPKGTILAIVLTTAIYLIIAWMCGICVERDAFGPLPELMNRTINVTYFNGNETVIMEEYALDNSTMTCEPGTCKYGLLNDMRVTQLVSVYGPITIAGIVSATLSSALASLISAPKVFQAVCNDKIFPGIKFFGKGYGDGQEPRRAYVLTFAIGVGCIVIGDLNTIAPLISNFFLMSYGLVCYSCADASLAKSPGWRPAFKYYNVWSSLLGTVLCAVVMFLMDWITALITIALVFILYFWVHYRKPDINWGDSTQAHVYSNALQHSQRLISVTEHVKNFRPQLLVLTGMPVYRPALIDLFSGVCKKVSLMVCGHVLLPADQNDEMVQQAKIPRTSSSSALKQLADDRYPSPTKAPGMPPTSSNPSLNTTDELIDLRYISKIVYKWLTKRHIRSFYNVIWANSLRQGVLAMMQSVGVGKLRPNTLILGFKSDWQTADPATVQDYFNIIHDAFDLNFGLGIVRMREGFDCTAVHAANLSGDGGSSEQGSRFSNIYTNAANGSKDSQPGVQNLAYYHSEQGEARLGIPTISETMDEGQTGKKGMGNVSRELVESMDRFNKKKQEGTIDVWWLVDDGGLTLLVPYLLSTKKKWAGCKLRVFMTTSGNTDIDLDMEKKHMVTLLKKFRISFSSVTLISDINREPTPTSLKYFDEIIEEWMLKSSKGETKETHPWKVSREEIIREREKTYRQIRIHELLKQYSMGATVLVVTLPVPRKGSCPSALYMSWLDVLTRDMPPIILLRGNQESVLTYYS